uniref:Uncharacterized protein n=1 Tax=Rhizophora mucronata TaxID=61149 RepID=A0A2P2QA79_RHIMU
MKTVSSQIYSTMMHTNQMNSRNQLQEMSQKSDEMNLKPSHFMLNSITAYIEHMADNGNGITDVMVTNSFLRIEQSIK